MKTRTTILSIFILTLQAVCGQPFEPLDLAQKIFGKDQFPNIDHYIYGEYKGQPNGQDIEETLTTRFSLLGQTEEQAVVGMTILDSAGNEFDTYLHFRKDTVWKMEAFRALAMTGIIEQVKIELENMTLQQVDSMIAEYGKEETQNVPFASREDYYFELDNAKLTLESDANLIKHFRENRDEFERLKEVALAQLDKEHTAAEKSISLAKNLQPDYRKLLIRSISVGFELGEGLNFLIGGILDNSVGYVYAKNKTDLPKMHPSRIIMLKEIGNGWYLYKTT